jgi:hypothetical protein
MICGGREGQTSHQDYWESELGIRFRKSNKGLSFAQNGVPYSRLLSKMGFHNSASAGKSSMNRKANTGSTLPPYLTTIIDKYEDFDQDEKSKSRRLLSDLVQVWFDTKSFDREKSGIRLMLQSQPTEEQIIDQGQELIRAWNHVFPRAALDEDHAISTFTNASGRGSYCGSVPVPIDTLLRLYITSTFAPIGINISVEPKFYHRSRYHN